MLSRANPTASHARCGLLLIALAGTAGVSAADDVSSRQKAVEQGLLPAVVFDVGPSPAWSIQERLARHKVPGISIAVINDGKIEWAGGYGEKTAHGTDSVSAETLFQAASVVKVVTAVTALRMVQDGALDLDGDVNLRLKNWKVPANQYTAQRTVTLRQLLSHSAGTTVRGFSGYLPTDTLPTLTQILEGNPPANSASVEVDTMPGEAYRYSGGGYEIVQQLIEDTWGMSFADAVQKNVLHPAGMQRSTFDYPASKPGDDIACGHTYSGKALAECWRAYPESAAAGLWTTPTDLAHLAVALTDALQGTSSVLNSETAHLMMTSVVGDAGLGPGVHGEGKTFHFDHAGWNQGFRSYLVMYPALGKGAVVMANSDAGDVIIDEVVRSVARAYQWPDFAPKQRQLAAADFPALDARVGKYDVADIGIVLSIRREAGHLVMSTPRGSAYNFYAIGTDTYVAMEDDSELVFLGDERGGELALRVWGMTAIRKTEP